VCETQRGRKEEGSHGRGSIPGRRIISPQPPQDGRWAIFVPASYKNMTLGEAQLRGARCCRPNFFVLCASAGLVAGISASTVYRSCTRA
jgi:hypothetical protein